MEQNNVKPKIKYPIIVEGKYDKIKLKSIVEATVITTDGFGIFNSKERQALIRTLAKDGLIILTDSDGAGGVIRSFVKGIVPPEKLYNLYVPKIEGKEKRKLTPSKEGFLGVEGIEKNLLLKVLSPFVENTGTDGENAEKCKELITKTRLFLDGLTGSSNSGDRRDALATHFGLPTGMSSGALMEALNVITDLKGYEKALKMIGLGIQKG